MVYRDERKRSGEGQSGLSDSVVPGFKADAKQSSPEDCLYADPWHDWLAYYQTCHCAGRILRGCNPDADRPRENSGRGEAADSQGRYKKVFPGWVMELVLLLQTNNVFMSVEATRDRAPVILREPVRQLLSEMQAAPGSVYPYLHFLDDFDLPDVKTAMRMLYAMDETGTGNAEIQMNALIKKK